MEKMEKKILIISPVPTHPHNEGSRIRVYNLAKTLKELGCEVHFLYSHEDSITNSPKGKSDFSAMRKTWDKFYSLDKPRKFRTEILFKKIDQQIGSCGFFLKNKFPNLYSRMKEMKEKAVKNNAEKSESFTSPVDRLYNPNIDRFLLKLLKKEKYNAVFVEFALFSKALELFHDDTLKILDPHDSLVERHKTHIKYLGKYEGLSYSLEEEAKALKRADIIIATQNADRKFFSDLTGKKTLVIGHFLHLYKPELRKKPTRNILFVGSPNLPNIHGISFFIKKVFPKIRKKLPKTKLLVAGGVCGVIEDYDGCIKLGELKDIGRAYNIADIVISPIFFGTGVPIKSAEALGYSKPLVATPVGVRGFKKSKEKTFLLSKNPGKFSEHVCKILSNKKLRDMLSRNAYKFARKYNRENIENLKIILKK